MKNFFTIVLSIFTLAVFSQMTGYTVDVDNGCYPLTVNFQNTSITNTGDYFIWEFDDGSANQQIFETNHLFIHPGHYWVNLRQFNYYNEEIGSFGMQIIVKGMDSIMSSTGLDACPGEKVWFMPNVVGNYNNSAWIIENDTFLYAYDIPYIFDTAGIYEIKFLGSGECGLDTIIRNIEITNGATPIVDFYTNGNEEICINDEMEFFSEYPAESYFWNFDDGQTDTLKDTKHVFTTIGGKNVTLTSTNICGNSASKSYSINVRNDINADAAFNYQSYGNCPNTPIDFSAFYFGTYNWIFDTITTSNLQNPTVLFPDTGSYKVQLILTNGCGFTDTSKVDTVNIIYDISNKPNANINFDMNDSYNIDTVKVCPGQEVSFGNYTYPFQGVDYFWDFGDGDSSVIRKPKHIFTNLGINVVTFIAVNQCMGTDTAYLYVDVDNSTMPNFDLGVTPSTICPGENAYFIDFSGDTENGQIPIGTIYNIDFGDGQTLNSPTEYTDSVLPIFYHMYENEGEYYYTFTIENLCGNSMSDIDTIYVSNNAHQPDEYLVLNSTDSAYGGQSICPNDPVQFIVIGGSSYEWHFGDNTFINDTNQVIYHTYADTGYYQAYVIITTNCGDVDTLYTNVVISGSSMPDAYFDISGNGSCSGDTLSFEYDNWGYESDYFSFVWNFDDGTIDTNKNAYHVFDGGGEYNISLSVTNGCGTSEEYRNVYINSPILMFSVSDNVVLPNENVSFNNTSVNAISYTWDFGDGTTSTQISPTHSYTNYGFYDITLNAINSAGCSSTETWINHILVSDIQINATVFDLPCNGYEVQINNGMINIAVSGGLPPYTITCQEDVFGQYAGEGQQNGVSFAGMPAGTYHIDITDANGSQVTKSYIISEPDPIDYIETIDSITCFGDNNGRISLAVTGGTPPYNFQWSFNQSTILPNNTNTIDNLEPGIYDVTITDNNGCYVSNNIEFELYYQDNLYDYINITQPTTCFNTDGAIEVALVNPFNTTVLWSDGSTNATFVNAWQGFHYVTITNTDSGCEEILTINVDGITAPSVDVNNFTENVCIGASDGVIDLNIYGGLGSYTTSWSTNVTDTISNHIAYNLSAGTYYVTVLDNGSGCEAYRTFNINEISGPELFFETQDPKCYGEYNGSAVVNPLSEDFDYGYQWSNGSIVNEIINRPAGTYTVTVTGYDYGCTTVGTITLNNPQEMTLDIYTSDVTIYGANDGVISLLVNNGYPPFNYVWSNGSDLSSQTDLFPGTYYFTVTDINNCTQNGSAIINEPAMIPISITVNDTLFCYGQTTNIEAPYSTGYTYTWSTGETTDIITVGETGTYTVTVTDGISIGIDSAQITVAHPYSDEKICMVTVDTSSMYNVIMWNKTENVGITEYKIYKLFGTQYLEIASQPFDDYSVYVDSSSQPNVHADRYKISIVDTCGNESDLSPYHQTMYLGISDNTIGGNTIVILDWDEAIVNEGAQAINWYYIYRGDDISGLLKIDSISGVFTGWNDNNALSSYYYRVAYNVDEACYPSSLNKSTGGPYNQSVSNIDDYSNGPLEIDEFVDSDEIEIYPNPFFDKTRIYMPEEIVNGNYSIKITDISGKRILLDEKVKTRIYTLYRNNLPNGIYFVEIKGDKVYRKKLIIN